MSGPLPPAIMLSGSVRATWREFSPRVRLSVGRGQNAGTYTFTLRVTDSVAATTTAVVSHYVSPLAQNYTTFPLAGTGSCTSGLYDQALLGLGGTGVYTWTAPSVTNVLPPGLSINAGRIVGRPTQPGTFTTQLALPMGAEQRVQGTRRSMWHLARRCHRSRGISGRWREPDVHGNGSESCGAVDRKH